MVALCTLALAGCSAAPSEAGSTSTAPQRPHIEQKVRPLQAGLSITDPKGQRITLPERPERIVCLSGLCDDMVVELGLRPAGTSNPELLTHPALLGANGAAVPMVRGSFGNEDVESIAALRPDLVIGLTGVHEPLRAAIENFAPLWLTEPATWEESVGYLRGLGALTGRAEQATAAERAFRKHFAEAVRTSHDSGRAGTRAVLLYGSVDSIGVDTAQSLKGHLLSQLFDYPFPAKSADVETAGNYSVEELLSKRPDVAFVYSLLFSESDRTLSEQLADNPVWQRIPAVQSGQVHEMHAKLWGSGRGTRSLAAILDEALARVPAR